MIDVKRKRGESFEAMFRRFSRRVQLSGRMRQAKKDRFYIPEKSKGAVKRSALRRIELQKHYDKLKKLGKLPEPSAKQSYRR